jgi:hypothetical protein
VATELFELELTDGPALALHEREFGQLETDYPWETLDPSRYPPLLVERARVGWTENAFNEFCTAIAMGQLVQALGEARAPLDLWSLACRFPLEELLHVELCSRVAMRLGGGAPIAYAPDQVAQRLDPSLTPLQRANELIVRLCCVGEAVSFPLLSGCMRAAAHPLTKAVLTKIVQDEALHGRLGFLYLDWVAPELDASEKDRLGKIAKATLAEYAPLWERLRSTVTDGVTAEGFLLQHVHELGWMEAQAYGRLATESIGQRVLAPLAKYGIRVT